MLPPPTLRLLPRTACDHLVEGQVVLEQPVGVDADLVLLLAAAPGVDLGRARHGAQGRLDDPVVRAVRSSRQVVARRW